MASTTPPAPLQIGGPDGGLRRAWAVVVVVAVVGAALWSLGRFAVEGRDAPTAEATASAAAALAERGPGPDDVVLVAPPWSLSPLLQQGLPGARLVPADGPWDVLHRGRHRRAFLWREPDADPWLQGRDHRLLQAPPTATRFFDTIALVEVDDRPARFDALKSAEAMQVVVDASLPGAGAPCTERSRGINGGVRCAGQPRFVRVAREWAHVTENGQDVLVVQPPPTGALRLVFDGVEVTDRLVLAAGHTRPALARLPAGKGTVIIDVFVDDTRVATLTRAPAFRVEPQRRDDVARFVGERDLLAGFQAEVIDTRAVAGLNRRLSFVVSTDHAEGNGIGLDAFVPGD